MIPLCSATLSCRSLAPNQSQFTPPPTSAVPSSSPAFLISESATFGVSFLCLRCFCNFLLAVIKSKISNDSQVRREEQELGGRRMTVSSTNPHNKEIAIRKRMISIFNKREDDFPSLREYNDYLEEVEDMTSDLIEGIDVAVIEAKIAKYQEENAEQIMVNRARKAEEFAAATAASKGHPAQTDNDVGASQNSQAGFGAVPQGQYAPTFPGGQPRPTGMGPQPLPLGGGDMGYAVDDEETMRLRARAGGWSIEISRKRALEEAFGSMWVC